MRGLKGNPWVLLILTLAAAAATARLGVWQLDRAAQKNALQADIDRRMALPPLAVEALARDPEAVQAQWHRRIVLSGRWLVDRTVFLDNRPMDGQVGFFVLTPLALDDGTAVLVQRGWEARDFMDRSHVRQPPTPDGEVSVVGRVAADPARLYEFDPAASGPIRQNLDLAAYARETGLRLRPVSVLQTASDVDDALRRDWPRPAADVHKHYGYAFQWFAMSTLVLALYVWFRIIRPSRAA